MKTTIPLLSISLMLFISCSKEQPLTVSALENGVRSGKVAGASTVNLNSGLIAFWPFNGNANEAGGKFNGVVYGAVLTTDRFGSKAKAYNFDGIDDYIFAPNLDQSYFDGKSYTISVWVNFANYNNNYPYILWGGNGGFIRMSGIGKSETYYVETVTFYTMQENGTSYPTQNGNIYTYNKVSVNQWHNVIVTKNISTNVMSIYVDGVLSNTAPYYQNGLKLINGSGIYFGKSTELINLTLNFAGKIDDVRMYNRVLNSSEITSLAKN